MSSSEKVRENRLRRMAVRQGLALQKSRRRDQRALDYGKYWLVNWEGQRNRPILVAGGQWGMTLEDVEDWLTKDRNGGSQRD